MTTTPELTAQHLETLMQLVLHDEQTVIGHLSSRVKGSRRRQAVWQIRGRPATNLHRKPILSTNRNGDASVAMQRPVG